METNRKQSITNMRIIFGTYKFRLELEKRLSLHFTPLTSNGVRSGTWKLVKTLLRYY